ncbi:MAG: YhcH/YjgK/YiaL family protein [Nitrospirae bacterium]|nr:YhcH/YjgK/YiaL family protein [Nitrospirota bacterium]
MIHDSLINLGMYLSLHPHFADVLAFLKKHENNLSDLIPGSYGINNNGAYASVSEYESKPVSEGFLEYHRKFIDIQIMIEGREKIGIARKERCRDQGYEEEKDMGKLEGNSDFITMDRTCFAIFFPQDAHMPQISCSDQRKKVKKVVFKVPVLD